MAVPNIDLNELSSKLDSNLEVSNKYVTEDEILKSGGIIYDPSRAGESGPSELPDVDKLLDTVYSLMECMDTPEMQALKEKDVTEYEFALEDKFPDFSSRQYSLFKMIVGGEDLTNMFTFFAAIDRVNKGQATLEDVEKQLGQELADQYVHEKDENEVVQIGLDSVEQLLECMSTDEMLTLKDQDSEKYLSKLKERFPEFSTKHSSLFDRIVAGEATIEEIEQELNSSPKKKKKRKRKKKKKKK